MKINEYFLEAKKISLSDQEKSQIFQKIHKEIATNSPTSNYMKYLKYIAITSGATLAIFVFLPIFNQTTNIQLKNGLISSIGGSSIVNANKVGEIINLSGNILINGVEYNNTTIYENQNLYLEKGKLEFNIGTGSKGIIIGPASFSIHKNGNNYEIEIISGSYFQINENTISQDKISVKTNELYISKTDSSKPFGVILSNQSGDIQITSQSQNIDIKTTNGEKFVLNASSSIKLAQNSNEQKIAFINSGAIGPSSSTKLVEGENEIQSGNEIKYSETKITYNTKRNYDNKNFSSSKNLDEKKLQQLDDLTYVSFLKQDIKQYKSSYENGDEGANILAYQNIASRINRIYETVEIDYRIDPTQVDVSNISKTLQKELKTFNNFTSGYQNDSTKEFVKDLNLITIRKFGYKSTKKPTNASSSSQANSISSSSLSSSSSISSNQSQSGENNNFSSKKNDFDTIKPEAQNFSGNSNSSNQNFSGKIIKPENSLQDGKYNNGN